MAQSQSGHATVKAVPSGDTLVLVGQSATGPPPELQLTLSGVQAPRCARGSGATDEPFAWAARDYLRKLALGKPVSFRVDGASGGRTFGAAWLRVGAGEPEAVAPLLVAAGWCRASGAAADDALRASEAEAKAAGRGAHGARGASDIRAVTWTNVDAAKFAGTPKRALVEHVRDGSTLRLLVYEGPDAAPHQTMSACVVRLAGIRCGRVPFAGPQKDADAPPPPPQQPDPYAVQAKHFVETRLLHREVVVTVSGAHGDAADVAHAASGQRIGVALLREGLGRLDERALLAAALDPSLAAAFRSAEAEARAARKRLWRAYEPPTAGGAGDFEGIIVEAVSGDTVVVADANGAEQRVTLSSVRAPRIGGRDGKGAEPWAPEAREALRALAVGRRVRVVVEQVRDVPLTRPEPGTERKEGDPTRRLVMASVRVLPDVKPGKVAQKVPEDKQLDVAERLLELGLLKIAPPRTSDDRAQRYDQLVAAEAAARDAKRRLHGAAAPPAPAKVADISGDPNRAKAHLAALRRAPIRATVEFVFAGGRVKLRCESLGVSFVFGLAKVRAPAPAGRDRPAQPGGEEAKAFARRHLLQRVVEASIQDCDRRGVFLGSLRLGAEDSKRSKNAEGAVAAVDDDGFESRLLARGLAKCDDRHRTDAWAALEAAAKEAKAGLWAHEQEEEKEEAKPKAAAQPWRARCAEVVDGGTLYVHADPPAALDAVMTAMRGFAPPAPTGKHRRNALVAAQFDDGTGLAWYRARVVEAPANGAAEVYTLRYVDFGNLEKSVPAKRVAALDPARAALRPAAVECRLAHVHGGDVEEENGEACARALHGLVWGKGLEVLESYSRDGAVFKVRADGAEKTVNELLVEQGVARVPRASKYAKDELAASMKALQLKARSARAGIWRYGDCDSDSDK